MPGVKSVGVTSDTYYDSVRAILDSTLETLQAKYGAVSLTSAENGSLQSYASYGLLPKQRAGISAAHWVATYGEPLALENREQALRVLADWELRNIMWLPFYGSEWKSQIMINMVRDWHLNGVIIHLNRGCEGTCNGVMENRLALSEAGIPVLTYEGNMGDPREVDIVQTMARLDAFMENLGLKKLDLPGVASKGI